MMNLLIVRTSSMGDLIHTWPAITELAKHYPNVSISWLAEENFAEIAGLHPAVVQVIPMALRKWRKTLFRQDTWREIKALRQRLKATRWDLIIDSQGLLKSAVSARLAGGPLAGYSWQCSRERLASFFYDKKVTVSWDYPAVQRNRLLFSQVLGYQADGPAEFGITKGDKPAWTAEQPYVVLLHASSRDAKLWPEEHWISLATALFEQHDLVAVYPWGSSVEQERARRLTVASPQAVQAPAMSLREASGLLGNASAVVGVDTGLTHLANALNVPLVAIYTDTDPASTGVMESPYAINMGGIGQCPSPEQVLLQLLSRKDFSC